MQNETVAIFKRNNAHFFFMRAKKTQSHILNNNNKVHLVTGRVSGQDVTITSIFDRHDTSTKHLSASHTKINIGSRKVVHSGLRQHGVVFKFRLAKRGAVLSNNHKLCASLAQSLLSGLVANTVLATLHNQTQTAVDRVVFLIGLLNKQR
jgi:hypothetical protein